jgi:hypothetical protein
VWSRLALPSRADRAGVDDRVGGKHPLPLGQDVVLPRLMQVLAHTGGGHEVLDGDAVEHIAEVLLEVHRPSPRSVSDA